MATFSIGSTLCRANQLTTSPGVEAPGDFHRIVVQLVDTNSQWGATPDQSRHITRWGFQSSSDGGTTWVWGPVEQEEPGGLPFGSRDRSGGMPAITLESSDVVGAAGLRLRLAVLVDAQIRLGATISVI